MSGTHLYYNGVELRDCVTHKFTQDAEKDESGTTIYSRFRIRVSSTVFGFMGGDDNAEDYDELTSHPSTVETTEKKITTVDRMQIIHRRLSTPRRDFWYAVHDTSKADEVSPNGIKYQVLLAACGNNIGSEDDPKYIQGLFGDVKIEYETGANAEQFKILRHKCVDANNGPKPIDVSIEEVISGKAFRISFEIEVCRTLCLSISSTSTVPSGISPSTDGTKSNKHVLSNTWSTEETCDDEFVRTQIIQGELRVRDHQTWAQAMRYLCLPHLRPGYRRKSVRFSSDPTNIVLKYRIEDQQAEAAPPWPAVKWKMEHTDSAINENCQVTRQLRIELTGKPRTPRIQLVGAALRLLDARFNNASAVNGDPRRTKDIKQAPYRRNALVVTQSIDKPIVGLYCEIMIQGEPTGGPASLSRALVESSNPVLNPDLFPSYSPDYWPVPRPFDLNTPVGIFATYLQSPCNQWHGIPGKQTISFANNVYDTGSDNPPGNSTPTPSPLTTEKYWAQADYLVFNSPVPFVEEAIAPVDASPATNAEARKFMYTHVDIDMEYDVDHGKVILPLSGPRNMRPLVEGSQQPKPWNRTAISINLHPGVMTRILTVNATRIGRPPELPVPAQYLIDPNGVVEELVDCTKMILDAPRMSIDNANRVFTAQMKLTYLLARPLNINEVFRVPNNPSLNSFPSNNWTPGMAIFSAGRIDYCETIESATSPSPLVQFQYPIQLDSYDVGGEQYATPVPDDPPPDWSPVRTGYPGFERTL
ncbi:MAG: hypothetical protein KF752_11690 [Pirellulaceae bacterium]|nr:hypothetical protein [Pirellulaceae bacterium]